MDEKEKELMRAWVENWKRAGPILEERRRGEIRASDSREFIALTTGILEFHRDQFTERRTSGLVQQQAFFRKHLR